MFCWDVKGIVHQNFLIHSLYNHLYADGRLGEVLQPNPIRLKLLVTPSSDVIKQKKLKMPPYYLCGVIQVSGSANINIQLEMT